MFLDICKQQWYDATKTLSLLLVVKKLSVMYGSMLSQETMLQTIYDTDKDIGTMLSITHAMWYTSAEKIKSLITKIQLLCQDLICTIESSENISVGKVEETLGEYNQTPTIVVDKKMTKPWLHISTNSHRYHRDIDSDLDALLYTT